MVVFKKKTIISSWEWPLHNFISSQK